MATLLERTREINNLLQTFEEIEYDSIARVISNIINANVYIVGIDGTIKGNAFRDDFECDIMLDKVVDQGRFPRSYAEMLLTFNETAPNRRSKTGKCAFADHTDCMYNGKNTTIVPIYGVRRRIGTLVVAKYGEDFNDDDLLLAEYGASVVGMEMLHEEEAYRQSQQEEEDAVLRTLKAMSFHEQLAVVAIVKQLEDNDLFRFSLTMYDDKIVMQKLKDDEGVVATEIYLMWNITRSVIVNSIRMMQVAKVVSSKSMGMKGTRLNIINNKLKTMVDDFIEGRLKLSENSDNDDISMTWNGLTASQKKKFRTYWESTMTTEERETIAGIFRYLDQIDGEDEEVEIPYNFPVPKDELKNLLTRMGTEMKRSPFLKVKSKGRDEVHVKLLNLYMMQFIRAYNLGMGR